jgi:hypothetical protein
MLTIKDPRLISQELMPFVVFWDQPGNFFSDNIDWKTSIQGTPHQSHAMVCINKGKFVTQRTAIFNAYVEIPMEQYMVQGGVLTFVSFTNNNPEFVAAFSKSVQKRLTSPWYVTQYDFLGIVGQAIGISSIHTPGLRYCSVDALRHCVNACPKLPKPDQIVINSLPAEINPELLYWDTIQYEPPFNQYGRWDSITGVIA